ncbi:DUF1127 domain-containing protein [Rhizobium rhizosphaerae]|uniref:DUF1127 domain-containing protein n=1 Tax=Xaviernesmea rhizosphaerae TaxID=1672749 RepID=UPI000ABACAB1|nr:DUF1127 domain-containing protein [Xaviernesmea rhizosphaerae]
MYLDTNETIFPDGYQRERIFTSAGEMVSPLPAPAKGTFARLIERFSHWRMRRAGRLVLRDLSDDQLRDIGISRAEAEAEVSKSFFFD